MIRFLMVRKERLRSGCEREVFYTIDSEAPDLERALTSGGLSEYELKLIGL